MTFQEAVDELNAIHRHTRSTATMAIQALVQKVCDLDMEVDHLKVSSARDLLAIESLEARLKAHVTRQAAFDAGFDANLSGTWAPVPKTNRGFA